MRHSLDFDFISVASFHAFTNAVEVIRLLSDSSRSRSTCTTPCQIDQ